MPDRFSKSFDRVDSPPRKAVAVTPNDSNDLADVATRIYVGGAGAISLIMADDASAVTLTAVPAGSYLDLRVRRVNSTGTTATGIVAFT